MAEIYGPDLLAPVVKVSQPSMREDRQDKVRHDDCEKSQEKCCTQKC